MRGIHRLQVLIALLLAGCASNTPVQNSTLEAFNACRSKALEHMWLRTVKPDGSFLLAHDPDAPAEPRIFLDCVRPYFAAQALRGIAQPGPDAPAAQRQGYADLDECLRRVVRARDVGGAALAVFPPGIRVTALNEDGTFRWEGDSAAGRRVTGCMRQKSTQGQQQASGVPAPPGAAGSIDGVYAGPVCYGPSPNDSARCYQAKATVRDGKIVGEWSGRDGVTVKLAGEVSMVGEVKIEMYAERADGTQFARANLSGTIQNGRFDAKGAFFNGRTVSFSWTLNAPGGDAPRK